jgi:ketosteroid isomerase-like protein
MLTPRTQFRFGWKRRIAAGTVLLLAGVAASQPAQMPRGERHESRHEIDQLEDAWREAIVHRNIPVVTSLLADDYMGITPSGILQSKDETLANLRSGSLHITSIQYSERKIRFYGRTALVTSRAEVIGGSAEGDLSGSYRYTHVWVRDDRGAWRIVSFEANRIRERGAH